MGNPWADQDYSVAWRNWVRQWPYSNPEQINSPNTQVDRLPIISKNPWTPPAPTEPSGVDWSQFTPYSDPTHIYRWGALLRNAIGQPQLDFSNVPKVAPPSERVSSGWYNPVDPNVPTRPFTSVPTMPWEVPGSKPSTSSTSAGFVGPINPNNPQSGIDDPEVWFKNYTATGGVSRAEFDAVWNDPVQRPAFQSAISENMAKLGTTSGTAGGSSGPSYENPYASVYSRYRVDPSWVAAYQAQHGGRDPISDYGSSGSSVGQGNNYAPRDWQRTPEQ